MSQGIVVCPGCGLRLKSETEGLDKFYNASNGCRQIYDELTAFTLSLRDDDFIHQTVADTYAAQHSSSKMKPITTAFALIGLYLTFEMGYSGSQIQKAHMKLAGVRRKWPLFTSPGPTEAVTVLDVSNGLTIENYKARILKWARYVWEMWRAQHGAISELVKI